MKSRIVIIFLCLLGMWSLMIFRAAQLQIFPNEKLAHLQKKQFKKIVNLRSRRGAISDRNNKELAVTVPSYSLFADPKIIKSRKKLAKKLSRHLPISFESIYKKIKNPKKRFVWIRRHLNIDQKQNIKALKLRGLGFIQEPLRVYPNDQLLAQTMGFVGWDGNGLEGLENKFDESLKGERKKVQLKRDARGRPLILNGQYFVNHPEGSNLQLTIDSEIQFVLERELSNAVKINEADSAIGIVMDPNTGEVLAMANSPGFNPNRPSKFPMVSRRNRSVTDAFEQGSTLKTFVIAGAIERNITQPNKKYHCEWGKFKIGKRTIRDSDVKHKYGLLSVNDILAKSSNIGVTKIAFDLGAKKLRKTLKSFGFGQKTKIDFPGESKGILRKLPWQKHLLSNISFGHGISATPLQVATAYSAIANGGKLLKPYLIKSIKNDDSNESIEFDPEEVRQVISEDVSATMRLMLTAATGPKGTGYQARIPGFPVAGKTGTAQKVNPDKPGYLRGAYIASFAGFVPANDPKFVIYIAVDNPKHGYYASTVAAPVFSKVAQFAVRRAGLTPILLSKKNLIKSNSKKVLKKRKIALKKKIIKNKVIAEIIETGVTPSFEGMSLREVLKQIKNTPLKINVKGTGRVAHSWPEPGSDLPESNKVTIFFNTSESMKE